MHIALISPTSQLHHCLGRPFQMMLPDFMGRDAYRTYYKRFGASRDTHLILDNGAFESQALSDSELLRIACDYYVDEVIAPDTIGNARASLHQLESFIACLRRPEWKDRRPSQVMAVVGGSSLGSCKELVSHIGHNRLEFPVTTLGIAKHLPATTGIPDARLQLTDWIYGAFPGRFDIHFLGFVSAKETMMANSALRVRSMDSSIPFICTADGSSLTLCSETNVYPTRQKDFATLPAEVFPASLNRNNIRTLDTWAATSIAGVQDVKF
jgi:hypothetical protein